METIIDYHLLIYLKCGIKIACISHVEHARPRTSLTPVTKFHLLSPEQGHTWVRHLVQLSNRLCHPVASVAIICRFVSISGSWSVTGCQDYVLGFLFL